MPLRTWDDRADWDDAYNGGDGLHYDRAFLFDGWVWRWDGILNVLGPWRSSSEILIVGCGFGWALEILKRRGFANVIGTDTSTHIQSTRNELTPETTARDANDVTQSDPASVILDEDALTQASRDRILNGRAGFDVIVTESVLESLRDAEAQALSADLRTMLARSGTLIHYVIPILPSQDPGYNWKTLEAWKALLPADTFVAPPDGADSFKV